MLRGLLRRGPAPGFYPAVEAGKQLSAPVAVAAVFLSAGPMLTAMPSTAG